MTTTSPAGDSTATRWLTDDEQSVWRAFLAMKTQLDAQLGRDIHDDSGLSMADFSVLVPLSEHPDRRMRILELARGLQWEKSRLSHQLTRMQQRGLIERSNCSEDRRGSFVVLTAQGVSAVQAASPRHVESVRRYLFDVLSADQVAVLSEIAEAVQRGIAEHCRQACDSQDTVCPEQALSS